MERTLQISFRGLEPSEAIERSVREHAARLDRFGRVMSGRVVIEGQHRSRHKGRIYHVRIDLTVPGGELVVRRDPAEHHAHEDVYVAIRDAFDAARRQLEDHMREMRAEVKHHEAAYQLGKVSALGADRDHGFITTADGREIYFHRNSVLDGGFEKLAVGTPVRFVEELGEKGPQATSVWPAG